MQAFRAVNSTLSGGLSRDDLQKVLRYHMVPGQVLTSNALLNGTVFGTSGPEQEPVRVRRTGNFLFVNSAQVVQQDILFANGVVHFLDNVLNAAAAAGSQATPDPTRATQAPVFSTDSADAAAMAVTEASAVASLAQPFTTALPCTANCPAPTTAADASGGGGVSGPRRTSSTATHETSSSKAYAARCTALPMQPAAAAAALAFGVGGYLGGM